MNIRRGTTILVAVLILSAVGLSTAFAQTSRPECDSSDSSSLCNGSVTIFVFVDRVEGSESSGFFNSGLDDPLAGARVTFVMPDGSRERRITGLTGLLNYTNVAFLPDDEAFVEVEYPAQYRDSALVPCPSSPPRRRITRESFGSLGSMQIVFCARRYMPVPTSP